MQVSDIAAWSPIAISVERPTPRITWADFTGIRFEEPFYDQTVARWTAGVGPRNTVDSDFGVLAALDGEPSLDPDVIIFHLSRCGSTLLTRQLGRIAGTLVLSEPAPVNHLLETDPLEVDDAALVEILRLTVRALGRVRFGDERRSVLKLSSWNIRRLDLVRRAFPSAKLIWIQRDPAAVLASMLAGKPGWMQLRRFPLQAAYLFGFEPDDLAKMSEAEFAAHGLAALCVGARNAVQAGAMVVDYQEMPSVAWTRVAPFLGIDLDDATRTAMADEASYYAKDPTRRVFTGDAPERAVAAETVRALAQTVIMPAYLDIRELAAGKAGS